MTYLDVSVLPLPLSPLEVGRKRKIGGAMGEGTRMVMVMVMVMVVVMVMVMVVVMVVVMIT